MTRVSVRLLLLALVSLPIGCGLATGGPADDDESEPEESSRLDLDRDGREISGGSREHAGTLLRAERPIGSDPTDPRHPWKSIGGPVPDPWRPPEQDKGSGSGSQVP
jgi:hypothetical protein